MQKIANEMELRDVFALAALLGWYICPTTDTQTKNIEDMTTVFYRWADAMMAARKKS